MERKSLVVFAPHPDDETLCCGGTIAKRLSEGYEVTIVVMTDGRNAFKVVLGSELDPTPDELRNIRRTESELALKTLGLQKEDAVYLDFEDGMLSLQEKKAEDNITEILANKCPTTVFFSHENDHNPDHHATYKIVRNAISRSGVHPSTYLYSTDLTFSPTRSLLNSFANLWRGNMVSIDITNFLDLKRKALQKYQSQISIISRWQRRAVIDNTNVFLKRKEVFFVG